ncbi:MAG TPA: 16S rRNA (cytosine(967)-C(5))-methyltransferase RsmB [Terracidiphilus sp.]|jgi:16S rRNA (cytosine967-C5)-methyltransferase|nr:16S rRNA (cytosine(967)-C(5))-methyltransferase RsmB [Terracidiphilus sp.]
MAAVSPARAAAFDILMAVERGSAHSDDLLRGKKVAMLSAADRHLTTALVLGVLRWQIRLDQELQALLARPNGKLDAEVRVALRLGAFQLRSMDRIPARAVIDESVEIAKQSGHHFASRMVNAVLRKLASALQIDWPEGTPRELALAQAHPAWMVERWADFYGLDATRAICAHDQSQPVQAVRLVDGATEEELVASAVVLEPGRLLTRARRVIAGDVPATGAFHEGRTALQDEGSQLVAELLGRGDTILDCCAAPGGKTLILAERNPAASIEACETSETRMARLKERLAVLGDRVAFRLADAASIQDENAFDLALADVPCSGTGTLRRNPEIRHRLHVEDLARQAERQKSILHAAVRAVRSRGHVVYSTCSLEPEENEHVVAAVLAEHKGIQVVPMQLRIEEMRKAGVLTRPGAEGLKGCVTPEGALRLLPGKFDTDGFFVALLEKVDG